MPILSEIIFLVQFFKMITVNKTKQTDKQDFWPFEIPIACFHRTNYLAYLFYLF